MEIIVHQKLKWKFFYKIIFLFSLPIVANACKPEGLNNLCDLKSDDFIPTVILQASTASGSYHCGYKLVDVPPFGYRYTQFRFYLNFPVSILPEFETNSSYAIEGNLPSGLSFDPATGEIKGTTLSVTAPTTVRVTRNSPGFATVNLTLQVAEPSATFVYGQYGSLTCRSAYNNGSCLDSPNPNNQNLSSPTGVVTDSDGGVYIAGVNRIQYFPPNTNQSTFVYGQFGNFNCDIANNNQSCGGGTASAGNMSSVRGIILDRENGLYATDLGNHRILYFPNSSNVPARIYGQTSYTTAITGLSDTAFNAPRAVALSPEGGLYVAEAFNIRIVYFPPGSTTATRVYGQVDFSSSTNGTSETRFTGPFGMAVDSKGGLYVADSPNHRVLYFPVGSTTATRVYGQSNFTNNTLSIASATALNNPTWIALDQSENLYVSDTGNNRVVVFPKSTQTTGHTAVAVFGQYNNLTCAVSNNVGACTGGSVNPASLYAPSSITFNRQGQLYINDQNNHRILVY
ncbi:putative Ig domain-containing protein [Leptospira jelokensis]|uniref:Teneurin NHL domain-containing protein n=1 Tax=Leptospira jelokensis TaxID=2484931 RepID=A0A4Z1A6I0_9LEPT|nr:putative Ig domain-containing protein [Leptospira jelokensis]TGL75055.1 hypothetical protein EHQ62_02945 [Leptospira jelokensis]